MQPASFAPRLSASIAVPDSDPKLMADTFTIDAGRNALSRSRQAPMILPHPRGASAGTVRPSGNGLWRNVMWPGLSISSSVPKPK